MRIAAELRDGYKNKIKNKLYGLLCEREKSRDWERFLDAILVELYGYPEEARGIYFYTLWFKLSSLKYLEFSYFRSTIFDCMNLISRDNEIF